MVWLFFKKKTNFANDLLRVFFFKLPFTKINNMECKKKRFSEVLWTFIVLYFRRPTKISKHPQAVRFFSADSPVTDWYKGQLSNALVYINNADVAFVMYYAPWDAESQYVKQEFEKAATIMGDQVSFNVIRDHTDFELAF